MLSLKDEILNMVVLLSHGGKDSVFFDTDTNIYNKVYFERRNGKVKQSLQTKKVEWGRNLGKYKKAFLSLWSEFAF